MSWHGRRKLRFIMSNKEIISQLRELISDRESFITGGESDEIYIRDKQALEAAVKALEARTSHWVEVVGKPCCYVCSHIARVETLYCPHCGARMDGDGT